MNVRIDRERETNLNCGELLQEESVAKPMRMKCINFELELRGI